MEGPYEDLESGEMPERLGVGENTGGPSMSFIQKIFQFYPDFIQILSRFYSDSIQILSRFFQKLIFHIVILFRFYPTLIRIKLR